uniref:CDGSH iron sulfur domain 1 n=1 Tax=Rousettus aegyptiacus TaxID=9407 RepID=A0A7J8G6R9_ROUAE|nr:CDGSH iron sulfur domain 1 [Rousettus aegyptiacus]
MVKIIATNLWLTFTFRKTTPRLYMLLTWRIWEIKLCTAVVGGPKSFRSVMELTQNTMKKPETTWDL